MKILMYGGKGWLGQYIEKWIHEHGDKISGDGSAVSVVCSSVRVQPGAEDLVRAELRAQKPDRVMCLIGRTRGPGCNTIDYLEEPDKLQVNIRDNLLAPIIISEVCREMELHLTYMGTGCIFDSLAEGAPLAFGPNDDPTFFGSAYSTVKGTTDCLMRLIYGGSVLNVRLRMPCTEYDDPRCFVTKICTYEKVIDQRNSISVLPTLIGPLMAMMANKCVGTVALCNPGPITHGEVLQIYKEVVDPSFTWSIMSLDEQRAYIKADRSNCQLDTRLMGQVYGVPDAATALREYALPGRKPRRA